MPKLTQDQKEALLDLKEHEGVIPLLMEIENAINALEKDVMTTSLDGSAEEERRLTYRKCKVEGARKIQQTVKELMFKVDKK